MSNHLLQALIFDVDGTLAETEQVHLAAFNQAFAELGIDWVWDQAVYTRLLDIAGGKERVWHYWRQVEPDLPATPSAALQQRIDQIHATKTAAYTRAVDNGAVVLRPGVLRLLFEAQSAGLRLAIATTTAPENVAALLYNALGEYWHRCFSAIGDAGNAPLKKPHPQVYLQVLQTLQLPASACLALEDSANGLQAASAAGLASVVTPSLFSARQDFSAAMRVVPDLSSVTLAKLRAWHHEHWNC